MTPNAFVPIVVILLAGLNAKLVNPVPLNALEPIRDTIITGIEVSEEHLENA
jgi:hypothetical protein